MFFYFIYIFTVLAVLKLFGIPTTAIQKCKKLNIPLSENEIHLDDNHPLPEVLNYDILEIKPYLNSAAWTKVTNAGIYVRHCKLCIVYAEQLMC